MSLSQIKTHPLWNDLYHSAEYVLIQNHYNTRVAKRSQVPLINHIHEGIDVLMYINAPLVVMQAYCLHPIFQSNDDLAYSHQWVCEEVEGLNMYAVLLAMEYRNIANQYLSHRSINSIDDIELGPLPGIRQMLIADKIQNYKDFLIYHKDTHERAAELDEYFKNWLAKLDCVEIYCEITGKPVLY